MSRPKVINSNVPEQIIIEFLEKDLFANIDEFLHALRTLKSAGISRFAQYT
jgi:EAL domain-containing protein (putative c-di-GMP-specific phosphodiesterase class I)